MDSSKVSHHKTGSLFVALDIDQRIADSDNDRHRHRRTNIPHHHASQENVHSPLFLLDDYLITDEITAKITSKVTSKVTSGITITEALPTVGQTDKSTSPPMLLQIQNLKFVTKSLKPLPSPPPQHPHH
jgi:hypothetical protein